MTENQKAIPKIKSKEGQDLTPRVVELFEEHRQKIYRQTDFLFTGLMLFQWIASIVTAMIISPRMWEGQFSQTHIHVWIAVFLGGAISLFPIFAVWRQPGRFSTRCIISTAQMLMSALLIHLSGGRIETHFHVFGSLAFLAFYRDWRVLLPATIVVALDHWIRGVYWPQSVFGVLTPSPYRWMEHAAWVIFEDIFLTISCLRSVEEMRSIALRTANLEAANQSLHKEMEERKQTEQALEKSEVKLRQAQKMEAVGLLAGGIAHDFNNLLTVINGHADLLCGEFSEDARRLTDLEEIQKAGKRAAALTTQLLAFSRRQIIKPSVLQIGEVIEQSVKLLRRLLGEHIEIVLSPPSDTGRVKVDPGQLDQIFMNLAVNARDAMPHGGKLIIKTSNVVLDDSYTRQYQDLRSGEYVMLTVTDTGVGMNAEVKEHIFEPFFTTKEEGKGTGLGLATVFGIVKQHQGHISFYSEPGHGATFKIYFPRVYESMKTATEADKPQGMPKGTETILVVEDEPSVRGLAVRILKMQGYDVHEAENGEEGLHFLEKNSGKTIHLLLTDVIMPKMSGKELADRVRKIRPQIKVIFSSGYTGDAIAGRGILEGDVNFIQKPFTPLELAATIRKVLDGGRLEIQ